MEIKPVKKVRVSRAVPQYGTLRVHIPSVLAKTLGIKPSDMLTCYVIRVNGKEYIAFSKN